MLDLEMQQKTDEMNRTHANADKIKAKVSREMYESMIKNHQYNHDYPLTDDVKERYRLEANMSGNDAARKYLRGEYRGPYWGV